MPTLAIPSLQRTPRTVRECLRCLRTEQTCDVSIEDLSINHMYNYFS